MTIPMKNQKIRSNVYLDVDLKSQAKEIFKSYGLSFSDGINLLLKQATDKNSPILISDLDIEPIAHDDPDYKLIQEAREARRNGEKCYSIDEVEKMLDL